MQADVGDPDSVDRAFGEIEDAFGPVEILVNNAGITADGLVARMTDDAWGSVLQTNLTGAFHTIRRASPKMMRARFGRIVNVSSVSGQSGQAGQANYSAAKAGMVGLSRAVARELAARNVTCNVVAPGPIVTAMTEGLPGDWRTWAEQTVPLGRLGTPEEVGARGGLPLLGSGRIRHGRTRPRRRWPRDGPLTITGSRRPTTGPVANTLEPNTLPTQLPNHNWRNRWNVKRRSRHCERSPSRS